MPAGPVIAGVRTHRSPALPPGDRGREFGRAQRGAVRGTVGFYLRLLAHDRGVGEAEVRRFGETVGSALAPHEAALDEIGGLAAGAGLAPELLLAVNARTELLAGTRYAGAPAECSVVGLPGARVRGGGALLAQNWDFHPDLAASRILWGIAAPGGGWLCTLTEAGILAKVGLNHRGLATAINFLATGDDGGAGGVPIHVLARQVLEAPDLSGALRALLTSRVTGSTAFSLAFADGEDDTLLAVEVTPAGARVLEPAPSGVIVHTNHLLAPGAAADRGLGRNGWFGTVVRHAQLTRAFGAAPASTPEDVFGRLRSHHNAPESICLHRDGASVPWEERSATLASLVIEVGTGRLWIAGGQPCSGEFRRIDVGRWISPAA